MDQDKVSILSLPVELLLDVAGNLKEEDDLSAFSRTCRRIHQETIYTLYDRVKNNPAILNWAAEKGRVETVKYLLAAGADPNLPEIKHHPRVTVKSRLNEAQDLNIKLLEMITLTDMSDAKDARDKKESNNAAGANEHEGNDDTQDGVETEQIDYGSLEDELLYYGDYSDSDGVDDEDDEDFSGSDYDPERDSEEEEDHDDDESEDGDDPFIGDQTFPTRNYWTPLHAAAYRGFIEIVELLLDYGADINALSRGYCACTNPVDCLPTLVERHEVPLWTPLHAAICSGNERIAGFLLRRGASTFVSTRGLGSQLGRVTALHSACYSGCTRVLKLLINKDYQTDIDCEDHLGMTPMSYAYYMGQWESIYLLAENGASLDTHIGDFSLFRHACLYCRFYEARDLLELGADSEYLPKPLKMSAVHCCCMNPYVSSQGRIRMPRRASRQVSLRDFMVKTLLALEKKLPDKPKDELETPLLQATTFHMAGTVELLLAAGAQPSTRNDRDESALTTACANVVTSPNRDFLRIVEIFLPYTSALDSAKAMRALCLSRAQPENKREVLRLLLEHGASDFLRCRDGTKMITQTVATGNHKLVGVLFNHGLSHPKPGDFPAIFEAVVQEDNLDGIHYLVAKFPKSALALVNDRLLFDALNAGRGRCARYLINIGVPITYCDEDGSTCMTRAAARKSTYLAKMLLARGADPNQADGWFNHPLYNSVMRGRTQMIQLLLDHGVDSKCKIPSCTYKQQRHRRRFQGKFEVPLTPIYSYSS